LSKFKIMWCNSRLTKGHTVHPVVVVVVLVVVRRKRRKWVMTTMMVTHV